MYKTIVLKEVHVSFQKKTKKILLTIALWRQQKSKKSKKELWWRYQWTVKYKPNFLRPAYLPATLKAISSFPGTHMGLEALEITQTLPKILKNNNFP